MDTLSDLIERLEKATGPDRELDCAIYVLLGAAPPEGDSLYWTAPGGLNRHYESLIPHYTASIDAALTLVPEYRNIAGTKMLPMDWSVGTYSNDLAPDHKFFGFCKRKGIRSDDPPGYSGATPATALCIAALKARASQNPPERA